MFNHKYFGTMKIKYIAPSLDVITINKPVLLAGSEIVNIATNSYEDDKDSEGLELNSRGLGFDED